MMKEDGKCLTVDQYENRDSGESESKRMVSNQNMLKKH